MTKKKKHTGLWTREEAYEYLDKWHYHMSKMSLKAQEEVIDDLCAMTHRPHCRKHMESIAPNYGSECTCDSAEKLGITE